MVDNISNGEEEISVEDIMKRLDSIAKQAEQVASNAAIEKVEESVEEKDKEIVPPKNITEITSEAINLNEYDINVMKQAIEKGYNAFEIHINISKNTLLKSARAFLIFKSLEDCGEIIKSIP